MKHTISVMVENKFGVLARISGLFSARGFNITSLAVGETEDPTTSRMTIVVEGDDKTLEQIKKDTDRDYWMSAEQALAYGLVGKIVTTHAEIA